MVDNSAWLLKIDHDSLSDFRCFLVVSVKMCVAKQKFSVWSAPPDFCTRWTWGQWQLIHSWTCWKFWTVITVHDVDYYRDSYCCKNGLMKFITYYETVRMKLRSLYHTYMYIYRWFSLLWSSSGSLFNNHVITEILSVRDIHRYIYKCISIYYGVYIYIYTMGTHTFGLDSSCVSCCDLPTWQMLGGIQKVIIFGKVCMNHIGYIGYHWIFHSNW